MLNHTRSGVQENSLDDMKHFVRSCVKCQIFKGENKIPCGKLQETEVKSPNEMLGVDIMGLFPCSPNFFKFHILIFHG